MPLTPFQDEVATLIAANRSEDSYLAGGAALLTPFGTFYGPNITPDPDHGIARWSDADFIRAMREGTAPDGRHYYPAFPYTSFTLMTDEDLLALKAYIFTLPPAAVPSRPHDLSFPFGFRGLMWTWKLLYLAPGPFVPDPARDADWNRGAYLVEGVGHCGECHTPRGFLGGRSTEQCREEEERRQAGHILQANMQRRESSIPGVILSRAPVFRDDIRPKVSSGGRRP